jgi:hypothetical protein
MFVEDAVHNRSVFSLVLISRTLANPRAAGYSESGAHSTATDLAGTIQLNRWCCGDRSFSEAQPFTAGKRKPREFSPVHGAFPIPALAAEMAEAVFLESPLKRAGWDLPNGDPAVKG